VRAVAAGSHAAPVSTSTGVVVGVDDTPSSHIAVDHAAIEAELRGWDLRIVHVQHPGDMGAHLLERLPDRVRGCGRWPIP
jgi:nucleotide-binding universal stress UspA family protein